MIKDSTCAKIAHVQTEGNHEGEVSMDVVLNHDMETFWATQKTMAKEFGVNVSAISKHLKNI